MKMNAATITLIGVLITATLGVIGNAYVAWFNNEATRILEREKSVREESLERLRLQQQLLLDAVDTDVEQAKSNLKFLIDTGLLNKTSGVDTEKILAALRAGRTLATPAPSTVTKKRRLFREPPPKEEDELRVHFLSVGAGNCSVVECPGKSAAPMIVDCGSSGGRGEMAWESREARQRVQDILARHQVAPNLVLSHGDISNYNWVPDVLDNLMVQHIWQGGGANTYGRGLFTTWLQDHVAQGTIAHQELPARWHNDRQPLGDQLSCGLASTFVLTVNSGGSKNSNSLVLMMKYHGFTTILPGDAVGMTEEFAEANFRGRIEATVLAASHGGSETHQSNSTKWIEATQPKVVVYSAGTRHAKPRCSVVERYKPYLASISNHDATCSKSLSTGDITYETDLAEYMTHASGTIVVTTDGQSSLSLFCESDPQCDNTISFETLSTEADLP